MKTQTNERNHNVVRNLKGSDNKIVNLNMTIYNDTTVMRLQLEEQNALIKKQNLYIDVLVKILKQVWTKRM